MNLLRGSMAVVEDALTQLAQLTRDLGKELLCPIWCVWGRPGSRPPSWVLQGGGRT